MVKAKIIILTPVYNDWKNLNILLKKIVNIFKKLKKTFELIIINDCSTSKIIIKKINKKILKKISIINLKENQGSQRAIAIGLRYINNYEKNTNRVIIMDSDGQDNPEAIPELIRRFEKKSDCIITVRRGQRKEPIWFRFFYEFYILSLMILTFKKLRFGNYSLLKVNKIKHILKNGDLWGAFPAAVSKNIFKIDSIIKDREIRYSGSSKMKFLQLINHALRVYSVFKFRILFFSTVYLYIFYLLLFPSILFYFLLFFSIIFNAHNFIISKSYQENFDFVYDNLIEKK